MLRVRNRNRLVALLLGVLVAVAGCSEAPAPVPQDTGSPSPTPSYDPSLEPAAAVLALVPEDATTLRVTDYDRLRSLAGVPELTGDSPDPAQARFERAVQGETATLTSGVLAPAEATYESEFGFTQDDVAWEARFSGPAGDGWVVKFRDDQPMQTVQRAAEQGVGPLGGATVDPATKLAGTGFAAEPEQSWAADPSLAELVGPSAISTYVARDCIPPGVALAGGAGQTPVAAASSELAALNRLDAWAIGFETTLVTVQLGEDRVDAFARARLAGNVPSVDPDFRRAFDGPVADPGGGRIGYTLGDPSAAVELIREQHLPFAVCAG